MRIGLDIMGGDNYPQAPVAGAVRYAQQTDSEAVLVLIGDLDLIHRELHQHGASASDFVLVSAPEPIGMDEHPSKAVLSKPQSSINVGLRMLREKQLDAFVSAGHTGAMLAGSVLMLGCIGSVQRPTVGTLVPANGKFSFLCDVGANTDCKPDHLLQFAQLGSMFMREVMQVQQPRVALLNVGEERKKGNQQAQQAYDLLEQQPGLHFIGNAQGWDLLRHTADVYVVDGFVGNIILKYSESLYDYLKPRLPDDPEIEKFNFELVGGLPFLGVAGNVIIGHGISGPRAFHNMIQRAVDLCRSQLLQTFERAFAH